ncbi:hypothetical protein ACFSTC_15905 [Nonomuraea ferruginea]
MLGVLGRQIAAHRHGTAHLAQRLARAPRGGVREQALDGIHLRGVPPERVIGTVPGHG